MVFWPPNGLVVVVLPNPPVAPPLPKPPEVEVFPPKSEPPDVLVLLLLVLPKPPKVEPVLPPPKPNDIVVLGRCADALRARGSSHLRGARKSQRDVSRASAMKAQGVSESPGQSFCKW